MGAEECEELLGVRKLAEKSCGRRQRARTPGLLGFFGKAHGRVGLYWWQQICREDGLVDDHVVVQVDVETALPESKANSSAGFRVSSLECVAQP